MKACGNDMKNKKMLKIITLSLMFWASFVVSTQTLAREKGDPKNDKETRKVDIDLRFNQRFTDEKNPVKVETNEATVPKLVEPAMQAAPAPAPTPAPTPEPTPAPAPAPAPVTADVLSMIGNSIPFQNGGMGSGQAIIDANPNGMSSTWGGATPYSGTDGLNTHFIGHHWGAFDPVMSLSNGGTVTVFDANGQAFNYSIYKIVVVDTYGNDVNTGASMYGEITSTGGGERIVLQTCIDETTRRIVFASA